MTTVRGLSSMATKRVLAELAGRVSPLLGTEVVVASAGGVEVARRIREGEDTDFVVLAADAIATLDGDTLLLPSVTPLFRSSVAVAVPADAPDPGVGSEDALREAVRGARRIAYSTGPSGTAVMRLIERWGLSAELDGRLIQTPPGVPVGSLLATRDADLGFQQQSELICLDGIRVLGTMPPGTEITTVFTGAVLASAPEAGLALAVLEAFGAEDVAAIVVRHGLAPARPPRSAGLIQDA